MELYVNSWCNSCCNLFRSAVAHKFQLKVSTCNGGFIHRITPVIDDIPLQDKQFLHKLQNVNIRVREDCGNYRPLTMLSIPSKVTESVACESLDPHMQLVLQQNQWGYRKGLSSKSLLLYLTEMWKLSIDKDKVVGAIFLFPRLKDAILWHNWYLLEWLLSQSPPMLVPDSFQFMLMIFRNQYHMVNYIYMLMILLLL